MMDEEIRQALTEVREMKKMCGNINMKLTNIVTQRGQDFKKKLEAEYQRGFEDGKAVNDKGCEGCKYAVMGSDTTICAECCNAYHNQWTAKNDKIEVGDEVEWNSNLIVVTRLYEAGGFDWCDGIRNDGRVFHILEKNARKTGRHFDIQSILGVIRI